MPHKVRELIAELGVGETVSGPVSGFGCASVCEGKRVLTPFPTFNYVRLRLDKRLDLDAGMTYGHTWR